MKSAITICLVPEAAKGPFVFHEGLEAGCRMAAELGFDAVEVFPVDGAAEELSSLGSLLEKYGLGLAAMGTGAGWLRNQWSLTHEDSGVRQQAIEFIARVIRTAGKFHAPAIVGSMQGRVLPGQSRDQVLGWLADGLRHLGAIAMNEFGLPLLYEPLNRYETNLFNRIDETTKWLVETDNRSIQILADMFHMNIEEASIANGILAGGSRIGHIHFADSNRSAIGMGHTSVGPVIDALRKIGYDRYLSAEVFPTPDGYSAAQATIQAFRQYC